MRASRRLLTLLLVATLTGCHAGIQRADLSFEPSIPRPAWDEGDGPVVLIDEAHANFHTVDGRYAPFANLLRRDGYVVRGLAAPASASTLAAADVYVVANAIAASDQRGWKLPLEPAFTDAEIEAIRAWVEAGGALFLIADHMPFPGSVESLAAAFEIYFGNGFLYDADNDSRLEYRRDGGLADHPITAGRAEDERVDAVRTFTGQAFRAEREIEPLLTVPRGSRLVLPSKAWKFRDNTPSIPADGLLQGAVFRHGAGRVAVFGEAAMFSAQERIVGDERTLMGMNRADATRNPQFLLNVLHWLTGILDEPGLETLEASLAAAERAFARAAGDRDRDAFRSFLTPDTVFATPHGNLRGPDAILEQWAGFFAPEGPSIGWEPDKVAVAKDGRTGMTSGPFWIETPAADGGATRFRGTFFSVWRRDAGGEWKIVLDTGTDAEPEGASGG